MAFGVELSLGILVGAIVVWGRTAGSARPALLPVPVPVQEPRRRRR